VAIIDPGDDGLERAEESASANALDYVNLNLNNLRLRAKRPVADALIAASCTRTVEGPSTLVLTFDDKDLALLRAGAIDINEDGRLDPIEVTLDTLTWRIVKAESSWSADASQLRLTFEEQACALLKSHNAHLVVSRANKTRAEFAHRLVQEVKAKRLAFFSPEEHFQPAVAKTPRDKKSRDSQAKPGFADNVKLKIKGATASNDQLQEIETSLKVADEENATGRARQAQMCAAIAESGFRAIRNLSGSKYSGVFQADPAKIDPKDTESQARHFLRGGLGFQGGGAIAAAAAHPDWSPGRIALEVEGSIQNFGGDIAKGTAFYQVGDDPQHSHISEAKAIISAWTGSAAAPRRADRHQAVSIHARPARQARNLMGDAAASRRRGRLAVLRRRRRRLLHQRGAAVHEPRPRRIGIDLPGLVSLEADWDDGKVVKQITLTVDAGRWAFRPGSIIALRDLGPLNGRWLVHTIDRPSLFDPATEITLTKPIARKKEPAADTIQVSRDVTDDAAKGVDAAYAAAKHLADLKIPYVWGGGHSEDLDDYNPNGGFDCSSGVSIVLHRAGLFDSDHAITSGELAKWGTPGKGRQLTVYANANHVFMVFDLPGKKPQAWEFRHTGTVGGFSGRAQNPGFENGFVARHAPGT
jgi:cell wall-associated NlpC family hydrolase